MIGVQAHTDTLMERALPRGLGLKIHLIPWPRWWLGPCSLYSGSLVLHRTSWEGLETSSSVQPLPETHSKLLNYLYKQKKKKEFKARSHPQRAMFCQEIVEK